MDEELQLINEQEKCVVFFETESTPGEDSVKIVEITIKDLDYYSS